MVQSLFSTWDTFLFYKLLHDLLLYNYKIVQQHSKWESGLTSNTLNSNKDFLQSSPSSTIHLTKYFSPLTLGELKVTNSDTGTSIQVFRLEKSFKIIKSNP